MLERDIKLNISKMTQKIVKKFSSPEKNLKKFQKIPKIYKFENTPSKN